MTSLRMRKYFFPTFIKYWNCREINGDD
jgi:hypothetical protein